MPAPTPPPSAPVHTGPPVGRAVEGRSRSSRRRGLSPRLRKLLVLVHIASGGAWLGIDVVLGVLVVTALTSGSTEAGSTVAGPTVAGSTVAGSTVAGSTVAGSTVAGSTTAAAISIGIAAFATWPIVIIGSISLVSGVLLGLGSKYGLVRYRWVLVKLALNVVLLALVVVVLVPGIQHLGDGASDSLRSGGSGFAISGQLLFPPIVSSTALVFAMTLSVFKPWGRTMRPRAPDVLESPDAVGLRDGPRRTRHE